MSNLVDSVLNQLRSSTNDQYFDSIASDDVEQLFGRNINLSVRTDSGKYFVKKLRFSNYAEKLENSRAYEALFHRGDFPEIPRCPRTSKFDSDHGLMVQDLLTDAEDGITLMTEQRFRPADAHTIGRQLSALHSVPVSEVPQINEGSPAPNLTYLDEIPLDALVHMTNGEINAYGLIQRDAELVAALSQLSAESHEADWAPIHGDLRVDQVLIDQSGPWIIDWEEFGQGDPARDTGSFIGEWIYRAVLDIPTSRGGGTSLGDTEISAGEIVRRGHEKAASLAHTISAFWSGYESIRPVDNDFVNRTGGFAGWHLLDRLFAGAQSSATLSPIQRAAAGVGRAALLNPLGVFALAGIEVTK